MDKVLFDKFLLKTAFCCIVADGHIDNREFFLIKSLCEDSDQFRSFDCHEEINRLLSEIKAKRKDFVNAYLNQLCHENLSEEEELALIDTAIKTIKADDQIVYPEVKFFKKIRSRLHISDEKILEKNPGIDFFLEKDIEMQSFEDQINEQAFVQVELNGFRY